MPETCRFGFLLFLGATLTLFSAGASAASISYFLDQSNENVVLPDGNDYLKVTIDDQGTPGYINFTVSNVSLTPGSNFGIQVFGWNSLLDNVSEADIKNLPTNWAANVDPPPNTIDGFGKFDIEVSNGGNNRQSPLTFSIDVAGDSIFSYAQNSGGNAGEGNVFFAAHVAGFTTSEASVTSAHFGGSALVPLPPAIWLFGTGAAALALRARRRAS